MSDRTFLLGAGASADAGIPTATKLLHIVLERTKQLEESRTRVFQAIQTALGGLRFAKPLAPLDIEELYQTLRALGGRREHPLAPFVGAWLERVTVAERVATTDAADAVVAALIEDLRPALQGASINGLDFGPFRQAMRDALATAATGHVESFNLAALEVLRQVIENCWIPKADASRVNYLRPLLESSRQEPVWIATLNYDNTMELAADACGIEIDRGVRPGSRVVRFGSHSQATLAKLHGSLDWSFGLGGTIEINAPESARKFPALIFGAGNKLRITGPYLDLLVAFRSQLEGSRELQVCGYSFRDLHINYLIYAWLEGGSGRHVVVSDPALSLEQLAENFDRSMTEAVGEMSYLGRNPVSMVSKWYSTNFTLIPDAAQTWAKRVG